MEFETIFESVYLTESLSLNSILILYMYTEQRCIAKCDFGVQDLKTLILVNIGYICDEEIMLVVYYSGGASYIFLFYHLETVFTF